jgi:Leucine-rich repeat (LRR) protein
LFFAGLARLYCLSAPTNSLALLPDALCTLNKLEVLDVSHNHISCLPTAITHLTALKSIRISENRITSLPSGMADMSALSSVAIRNNPISAGIEDGIAQTREDVISLIAELQNSSRSKDAGLCMQTTAMLSTHYSSRRFWRHALVSYWCGA